MCCLFLFPDKVGKIHSLFGVQSLERPEYVSSALKWSTQQDSSRKSGHPELHHRFAMTTWQGENYRKYNVFRGSGCRLSIRMLSYQYRKSHSGDKVVKRSSYLHNGISCTNEYTISMTSCKTAVTPLLMHWSYCSLAPSHRYKIFESGP